MFVLWLIPAKNTWNAIDSYPHFINILQTVNNYRKVSNIRRTKSQNLNASSLTLLLPLPNPLKPGVKLRMKM